MRIIILFISIVSCIYAIPIGDIKENGKSSSEEARKGQSGGRCPQGSVMLARQKGKSKCTSGSDCPSTHECFKKGKGKGVCCSRRADSGTGSTNAPEQPVPLVPVEVIPMEPPHAIGQSEATDVTRDTGLSSMSSSGSEGPGVAMEMTQANAVTGPSAGGETPMIPHMAVPQEVASGPPLVVPQEGASGPPLAVPQEEASGPPLAVPQEGASGPPLAVPQEVASGPPLVVPQEGASGPPPAVPQEGASGPPLVMPQEGASGPPPSIPSPHEPSVGHATPDEAVSSGQNTPLQSNQPAPSPSTDTSLPPLSPPPESSHNSGLPPVPLIENGPASNQPMPMEPMGPQASVEPSIIPIKPEIPLEPISTQLPQIVPESETSGRPDVPPGPPQEPAPATVGHEMAPPPQPAASHETSGAPLTETSSPLGHESNSPLVPVGGGPVEVPSPDSSTPLVPSSETSAVPPAGVGPLFPAEGRPPQAGLLNSPSEAPFSSAPVDDIHITPAPLPPGLGPSPSSGAPESPPEAAHLPSAGDNPPTKPSKGVPSDGKGPGQFTWESMFDGQPIPNANTFRNNSIPVTPTSGQFISCKANSDCFHLREPAEWCQKHNKAFIWPEKGCYCAPDTGTRSCIIERRDSSSGQLQWTFCSPDKEFDCDNAFKAKPGRRVQTAQAQ